ncbi:MAG: CHAD domain-containing protein [Thaumarchaeota archaeon]|nr:CHAD domain-containing protein [Nitrososphaerota archaeon]
MDNASLTPAHFVGEYENLADRVGETLREYLGDPNEENTRNVRAAARKLATCIGVMPKGARDKTTRRRRDRSRKLLLLTSDVRDIDIMRAKLAGRAGDATVDLLLRNMAEEREERAGDSMKAAWKLFELRGPKLTKKEAARAAQWVKKTLEELDEDVSSELSVVVKNEGRVDELHSLRKNAKRFRYTLELIPAKRASSEVIKMLKQWQDVLGEIRDSDVLIEYLGRARPSPPIREILSAERNFRHQRYLAFVRAWRKWSREGADSLLSSAGLKQAHPK